MGGPAAEKVLSFQKTAVPSRDPPKRVAAEFSLAWKCPACMCTIRLPACSPTCDAKLGSQEPQRHTRVPKEQEQGTGTPHQRIPGQPWQAGTRQRSGLLLAGKQRPHPAPQAQLLCVASGATTAAPLRVPACC